MTPDASASAPEAVTRTEVIGPEPAEALAGLLDLEPPGPGGDLPPLWHWVYLLERRPQRDLGPDGHPTTGIPAPPGPGQRRMFAGGRVTLYAALRLGEPATRTTRLVRTVAKQGRSGPMTFSTVRHDIEQGGRTVITEEQDIVYRAGGSPSPPPPLSRDGAGPGPSPETGPSETGPSETGPAVGRLELPVDPVVLFRFSALTYNAHRIHYDAEYAGREGYPGLVVHGPLQALLMGECLRRSGAPLAGRRFGYRLLAPTFGAQRLRVTAHTDGPGLAAQVWDARGVRTATATVQPLGPPPPGDAASCDRVR
jgi:3-methylfumaryl-CoA hydratase